MRQLSYLVALDKHRHFARAAASCSVSQPALSAGIRELEQELGITIIKRSRIFQGITPEGERVLGWARQVISSLDGLRQEADLVRAVPGGHLAIGAIPSAVKAGSMLCAGFRRVIPDLTLEVYTSSNEKLLRRLKRDELHFGITYAQSSETGGYDALPLYTERYVLVASAKISLPDPVGWADVAKLPLCLFSHEMQNRRIIDSVFSATGLQPKIVLETNAIEVLLAEVAGGGACSIMPFSALPAYSVQGTVRTYPILPERSSSIALVRVRRPLYPPLSHAVWGLARRLRLQELLDSPWQATGDNPGLSGHEVK